MGFFFRRLSKELDVKLLILGNYLATVRFVDESSSIVPPVKSTSLHYNCVVILLGVHLVLPTHFLPVLFAILFNTIIV